MKKGFGQLALGCVAFVGMNGVAAPSAKPTTPAPTKKAPVEQYTASIQFRIEEPTPQLLVRSRKIVVNELQNRFKGQPDLNVRHYRLNVSPTGDAIYFQVSSDRDIQVPTQQAVSSLIGDIEGKVRARGQDKIHRINLAQRQAFLDIELADPASNPLKPGEKLDLGKTKIRRIIAISVPVGELLRELNAYVQDHYSRSGEGPNPGQTLDHPIDETCAQRRINWRFGISENDSPKTLDEVMEILGVVLNTPGGVKKISGSYVFGGTCPVQRGPLRPEMPTRLDDRYINNVRLRTTPRPFNVRLPFVPIGR